MKETGHWFFVFMFFLAINPAFADFKNHDQANVHIYGDNDSNLIFSKTVTDYTLILNKDLEPSHVLKHKTLTTMNTAVEGASTESYLELFKLEKGNNGLISGASLWSTKTEGEKIRQKWNFVDATIEGCCGASSTHFLLSLRDGKKVMTYLNDGIFRVTVPNSKTIRPRIVALMNEFNRPQKKGDQEIINVATLGYIEENGKLLDKIHLNLTVPNGATTDSLYATVVDFATNGKTNVKNQDVELWASNHSEDGQSAFRGFAFKGVIRIKEQHYDFLIPVLDHRFDLSKAILTPGLESVR